MSVYELQPEVPCDPGPDTVWDNSVIPPRVSNISLEFDGWLGDDLVETYPLFAVTDRLRAALEGAGLRGVSFERVSATKSEQFADLRPDAQIGTWSLMQVTGHDGGGDDVWLNADRVLVVSRRFWDVATRFQITHCDVVEHAN